MLEIWALPLLVFILRIVNNAVGTVRAFAK